MKIEDAPLEPEDLEGKDLLITSLAEQESTEKAMEGLEKALETGEPFMRKNLRPGAVRKLMTPKRRELTQFVKEENPESISQTARELDRNLSDVNKDLKLLEDLGLLYFKQEGRGRKPVIPFNNIQIKVDFLTGEEKETGQTPAKA